jgi:hypothetical protein
MQIPKKLYINIYFGSLRNAEYSLYLAPQIPISNSIMLSKGAGPAAYCSDFVMSKIQARRVTEQEMNTEFVNTVKIYYKTL